MSIIDRHETAVNLWTTGLRDNRLNPSKLSLLPMSSNGISKWAFVLRLLNIILHLLVKGTFFAAYYENID